MEKSLSGGSAGWPLAELVKLPLPVEKYGLPVEATAGAAPDIQTPPSPPAVFGVTSMTAVCASVVAS
jgi:hypothetical protein